MIAYIIIVTLLILIFLLFIPLKFYGQGSYGGSISAEIWVTWAWGGVSSHWYIAPSEPARSTIRMGPWISNLPNHKVRSPNRNKTKKPKTTHLNWAVIRTCLDKQVFRELHRFLIQIWQSLSMCGTITGEFGTYDPALTGYITALIAMLNVRGLTLRLIPQFADNSINLRGNMHGKIIPGFIIRDLGIFVFKKPIRNIWLTLLRNRDRSKR